jgi:hypothetical protein
MAKTQKQQAGRNGGTLNVGGNQPGGGRPKLPDIKDLMDEVMGEVKEGKSAMQVIFMQLRLKATKGDVQAAKLLLEYAYGKPKQTIAGDPEAPLFSGDVKIVFDGGGMEPITSEAQIMRLIEEADGQT